MSRTPYIVLVVLGFLCLTTLASDPAHPLQPLDRSSPRAALTTFLEEGDALGAFLARDYLPSPSRAEFLHMTKQGDCLLASLDLNEVPPASRPKLGRAAAIALYETLSRIPLPALAEIPDVDQAGGAATTNVTHWVVPNTEIALVRAPSGPRSGEFLFSPETVANAGDFCTRVRGLEYTRPFPLKNLQEVLECGGGWMIPYTWVQTMPRWLLSPFVGQALWKWIAFVLIIGIFAVLMVLAFRLSRRGSLEHPFRRAVAQLVFPIYFLLGAPVVAYLSLVQLNMRSGVGSAIELIVSVVVYLSGAWIAWRSAPVIAEAIIASPRIASESLTAHLVRICTRLLGIVCGATLLAMGANQGGVPVYGIIAGLGVGGLAIALAAQPTIENLIGGLSLFADKPVEVGDLCRCGSDEGTIEAIGIRSTRIRGIDRTLTSIPNAELSKMAIMNFAQRDRMLIKTVLGVRYETSPDQLRYLLAKIRELLAGHPRIDTDTARAQFVGFGDSALNIEVVAYVMTSDRAEFLGVQEDLLLRVMDVVAQSGTGIAFPSQTLYLSRDHGLDASRTQGAEAEVRQGRDEKAPSKTSS
jgi:MscS family membrane protein